jgi:hypothetical protein
MSLTVYWPFASASSKCGGITSPTLPFRSVSVVRLTNITFLPTPIGTAPGFWCAVAAPSSGC